MGIGMILGMIMGMSMLMGIMINDHGDPDHGFPGHWHGNEQHGNGHMWIRTATLNIIPFLPTRANSDSWLTTNSFCSDSSWILTWGTRGGSETVLSHFLMRMKVKIYPNWYIRKEKCRPATTPTTPGENIYRLSRVDTEKIVCYLLMCYLKWLNVMKDIWKR